MWKAAVPNTIEVSLGYKQERRSVPAERHSTNLECRNEWRRHLPVKRDVSERDQTGEAMRKTRAVIIVLCVLCSVGATTLANSDKFSLTISLSRETVPSGARVPLDVKLANTSDSKLEFVATVPACDYTVEVHALDKSVVPKTKYGNDVSKCQHSTRATFVQLKPGDTWEDTIDVDQLYDLSQPGGYSIQISREIPKGSGHVKSNTILLTVVSSQ